MWDYKLCTRQQDSSSCGLHCVVWPCYSKCMLFGWVWSYFPLLVAFLLGLPFVSKTITKLYPHLFIFIYINLYLFIFIYIYLYLFIFIYIYLYLFIFIYIYLYLFDSTESIVSRYILKN